MMRKQRGLKLHDLRGLALRMLSDWNQDALVAMNSEDRFDLETRCVGQILKIRFEPRIFLPLPN